MTSHFGRDSIITQLKKGGVKVEFASWSEAELKKSMDPSHNNCFIPADKGDMVDLEPDEVTFGYIKVAEAELKKGDARYEASVEQRQRQHVCGHGCEGAVLDLGWRRSVRPLLGAHFLVSRTEAWLLAGCAFQKLTPLLLLPTTGAWSVSLLDPQPFLRRCFPGVADLAKNHWRRRLGVTLRKPRTAPRFCKNMRWSPGSCVECTFGCLVATWFFSETTKPKNISRRLRAAARKTEGGSAVPACRYKALPWV